MRQKERRIGMTEAMPGYKASLASGLLRRAPPSAGYASPESAAAHNQAAGEQTMTPAAASRVRAFNLQKAKYGPGPGGVLAPSIAVKTLFP